METKDTARAYLSLIQNMMDHNGGFATADGPTVFVNGFGRFVARVERHNGQRLVGFGDTIEEALGRLVTEITNDVLMFS